MSDEIEQLIEIADLIIAEAKKSIGDQTDDPMVLLGAAVDTLNVMVDDLGITDEQVDAVIETIQLKGCLLYTSPSPRD